MRKNVGLLVLLVAATARAGNPPGVSVASVRAKGGLDRGTVALVLQRRQIELDDCVVPVDQAALAQPRRVIATLAIEPSGQVRAPVEAQGTLPDATAVRCLAKSLEGASFPKTYKATQAVVTLLVAQGAQGEAAPAPAPAPAPAATPAPTPPVAATPGPNGEVMVEVAQPPAEPAAPVPESERFPRKGMHFGGSIGGVWLPVSDGTSALVGIVHLNWGRTKLRDVRFSAMFYRFSNKFATGNGGGLVSEDRFNMGPWYTASLGGFLAYQVETRPSGASSANFGVAVLLSPITARLGKRSQFEIGFDAFLLRSFSNGNVTPGAYLAFTALSL